MRDYNKKESILTEIKNKLGATSVRRKDVLYNMGNITISEQDMKSGLGQEKARNPGPLSILPSLQHFLEMMLLFT